jgi:hypothetical protein
MTSHEFARYLLSKPDLRIFCPLVHEYAEDAARVALGSPTVTLGMSEDRDGKESECLVISAAIKQ